MLPHFGNPGFVNQNQRWNADHDVYQGKHAHFPWRESAAEKYEED
jgi:hypothetical protein